MNLKKQRKKLHLNFLQMNKKYKILYCFNNFINKYKIRIYILFVILKINMNNIL